MLGAQRAEAVQRRTGQWRSADDVGGTASREQLQQAPAETPSEGPAARHGPQRKQHLGRPGAQRGRSRSPSARRPLRAGAPDVRPRTRILARALASCRLLLVAAAGVAVSAGSAHLERGAAGGRTVHPARQVVQEMAHVYLFLYPDSVANCPVLLNMLTQLLAAGPCSMASGRCWMPCASTQH